jgi:hypothetical protein
MMVAQTVYHPQFGPGRLLKTYMSGMEWEVQFDSGRRFRLPARQFNTESANAVSGETLTALPPRTPMLDTDQFRARQTLEALRVGVVPVQDAETLTIGLEAERVSLNRALARANESSGDVMAIIGDYGFGKSHFIELASRRSLQEGFIVASASLDLVEVPPSRAHKIYEALATSLRYPDTDERGLAPLIQKALEKPSVIAQFTSQCPLEVKDCPLSAALIALQNCPSQSAFDEIIFWLSGQTKPQNEMKTCLKKPPRLYMTGEIARQYSYLLTGISTLATLLGYSGLAVMIDESEHYSLLRSAQRERADSFFKAMILSALGLNNGRIEAGTILPHPRFDYPLTYTSEPHLLFLFALTESSDRMPVGTWLAPSHIVRLDDRFIERDVFLFFKTLLQFHKLAYEYPLVQDRYEEAATTAPVLLSKALSQHRINLRELIRGAVTVCDLLYLYPDYPTSDLLDDLKHGLKV